MSQNPADKSIKLNAEKDEINVKTIDTRDSTLILETKIKKPYR